MSFGLRVNNQNSNTVIDSSFLNYALAVQGTFTAVHATNVTVGFAQPITSLSHPVIAFQRWAADGFAIRHVRCTGGPGNWTGFTCRAFRSTFFFPSAPSSRAITYRVYAPGLPVLPDSFGMRVYDQSGGVVFDSARKPLIFSRWTQLFPSWTQYDLVYSSNFSIALFYSNNTPVLATDYVAVSLFEPIYFFRLQRSPSAEFPFINTFVEAGVYFRPGDGRLSIILDSEDMNGRRAIRIPNPNIPQFAIIPA